MLMLNSGVGLGSSNAELKMVQRAYRSSRGARRYNPVVSGDTCFRQNSVEPLLSWMEYANH